MENSQKRLTRRDFIRGTVGATLAASVMGAPWATGSAKEARSNLVTVVRDKNVMDPELKIDSDILQTMLERTVQAVTGKDKVREARALHRADCHSGSQGTLVNWNRDGVEKLHHVFRPTLQLPRREKCQIR